MDSIDQSVVQDQDDDEESSNLPDRIITKKRPIKNSGQILSGEKPTKRVRINVGSGSGAAQNDASMPVTGEFSIDNGVGNDEESKIENQDNGKETKGLTSNHEPLNAKKPVRKWEKRWILQPSIIESGEVWIQKWICIENLTTKVISDNTIFND